MLCAGYYPFRMCVILTQIFLLACIVQRSLEISTESIEPYCMLGTHFGV